MIFRPKPVLLRGEATWQKLDRNGRPLLVPNSRGVLIPGATQKNLITDQGIEDIGTIGYFSQGGFGLSGFRRNLLLGTGTTTPTNADTALTTPFTDFSWQLQDYPAVVVTYTWSGTKVTRKEEVKVKATMNSAVTLAEFGFDNDNGNLSVHALLKDEAGTATPIAFGAGEILLLSHSLYQEIDCVIAAEDFAVDSYDVADTLLGTDTISGDGGPFCTSGWEDDLFSAFNPSSYYFRCPERITSFSSIAYDQGFNYSDWSYNLVSLESYVADSKKRVKNVDLTTSQGNGDHVGVAFGRDAGYKVLFRASDFFTKTSTQTFKMQMEVSWARA